MKKKQLIYFLVLPFSVPAVFLISSIYYLILVYDLFLDLYFQLVYGYYNYYPLDVKRPELKRPEFRR